jgi:hypothetical protein
VSHFFCRVKSLSYLSLICMFISLAGGAYAKAPQDAGNSKNSQSKGASKAANDSDTVLGKNSEATLYLLSGWGKTEGPYIWYTVSTHLNKDQLAPDGKTFNLFSASGALDCKENTSFYYRTSYMFFDVKAGALNEIYFEKNKSNPMLIDSGSIESDVKNIVCK